MYPLGVTTQPDSSCVHGGTCKVGGRRSFPRPKDLFQPGTHWVRLLSHPLERWSREVALLPESGAAPLGTIYF